MSEVFISRDTQNNSFFFFFSNKTPQLSLRATNRTPSSALYLLIVMTIWVFIFSRLVVPCRLLYCVMLLVCIYSSFLPLPNNQAVLFVWAGHTLRLFLSCQSQRPEAIMGSWAHACGILCYIAPGDAAWAAGGYIHAKIF